MGVIMTGAEFQQLASSISALSVQLRTVEASVNEVKTDVKQLRKELTEQEVTTAAQRSSCVATFERLSEKIEDHEKQLEENKKHGNGSKFISFEYIREKLGIPIVLMVVSVLISICVGVIGLTAVMSYLIPQILELI